MKNHAFVLALLSIGGTLFLNVPLSAQNVEIAYRQSLQSQSNFIAMTLGDLEIQIGLLDENNGRGYGIQRITKGFHDLTHEISWRFEPGSPLPNQSQVSLSQGVPQIDYVQHGGRVTLKGEENGVEYEEIITLYNSGEASIDFCVKLQQPIATTDYFYITHKVRPTTYRDNGSHTVVNNGTTEEHMVELPFRNATWTMNATRYNPPIREVRLLRSGWRGPPPHFLYQVAFQQEMRIGVKEVKQHIAYDFGSIVSHEFWKPTTTTKRIALAQSFVSGWYDSNGDGNVDKRWHHRTRDEIRRVIRRIAPHFDALVLGAFPGYDHLENFTKLYNTYIKIAHQNDLDVAFSITRFRYPRTYGSALETIAQIHPEYLSKRLKITGNVGGRFELENAPPEPHAHLENLPSGTMSLDIANDDAVKYITDSLRAVMKQIKKLDYLFFDEDAFPLSYDDQNTPFVDVYYKSPTYSRSALESFRLFVHNPLAKFPVHDPGLIPNSLNYLLESHTLASNGNPMDGQSDSIWKDWLNWRESVFANWLDAVAKAVSEVNHSNKSYKGAIYFCSANNPWPKIGNNNGIRLSGVNPDEILESNYISWFVMESIGMNPDLEWSEWQISEGKNFALRHNKKFGAFVEAINNGSKERVEEQMRIGLEYGADMIVVHNDSKIVERSQEPALPAAPEYDNSIERAWDSFRFNYMWQKPEPNTSDGVTLNDHGKLEWSKVPLARKYIVEIANNSAMSGTVYTISTTRKKAKLSDLPDLNVLASGTYYWRVRARFVIDKLDFAGNSTGASEIYDGFPSEVRTFVKQ